MFVYTLAVNRLFNSITQHALADKDRVHREDGTQQCLDAKSPLSHPPYWQILQLRIDINDYNYVDLIATDNKR